MTNPCSKKVLIVEDSHDNQLLLKILLEARGFTTHSTHNGQEALTLLNSMTVLPDAILLDLRMPVMDGITFRHLQKADPRLCEIPVVVMSGEDNLAAISIETNSDVLQKPLNISALIQMLQKNVIKH